MKETIVTRYLAELVSYGGEIVTVGEMIIDLQNLGVPPRGIDMFLMGHDRRKKIRDRAHFPIACPVDKV